MKKMSKTLFGFILGIFVSFAINVAAEAVISSGAVSYSNTTVSAALDELFAAVDINNKIGTTDISAIGDGTLTGAINNINDNKANIETLDETIISTINSTYVSDVTLMKGFRISNDDVNYYNMYFIVTIESDIPSGNSIVLFKLNTNGYSGSGYGRMMRAWVAGDFTTYDLSISPGGSGDAVLLPTTVSIPAGSYFVYFSNFAKP